MKNTKVNWRTAIILGGALAASAPAAARDPFTITVTVDAQSPVTFGVSGVEDAIESINFEELTSRGVIYTERDLVDVELDFRGLPTTLFFANNSDILEFEVGPNGAIFRLPPIDGNPDSPEGTNANRRLALDKLVDELEKNPDLLKKLLTALARFSPIDPLAGNPASLFSRTQDRDFSNGFTHKVSQIFGCGTSAFNFSNDAPIQVAVVGGVSDIFADAQARAAALQAENELGVGLAYQNTTAKATGGDFTSSTLTLPLSYTVKFDSNPSHKLRFDLPLTATDSDGAETYSLGFGLAYTYPITDVWSLTPAAGVGATGSADLGAAGGVSAYSLTSAYTWRLGDFALSMGNSIGKYDSLGIKIGDVEAEADISNTVFSNGFLLSGPNSLIARNLVVEYSFLNTQIGGDEVYSDGSNEVGVALGYVNTEQGIISSYVKAGLSYQVADGLNGDINTLRLNLAARF
jgi:hypothetical protein